MKQLKFFILFSVIFFTKKLKAQIMDATKALSTEKREAYIQKASEFRKQENYTLAIQQLDTILLYKPNDAQILLFRGDLLMQNKNFAGAAENLKKLLPLNYEATITRINLSYALFMNHKPANALQFAKVAWENDKANVNANVNYFNAMLWNIKTKEAETFLAKQKHLLSVAQILVLEARLKSTSGDYKNGLAYYDSLTKTYPNKYYVQEYSDVMLGKKDAAQAIKTMKAYDTLFTKNENKNFAQKIRDQKMQQAGAELVWFIDIGNNIRLERTAFWQQGGLRSYQFGVKIGFVTYTSPNQTNSIQHITQTNAQVAVLSIKERWSKALSGSTDISYQNIIPKFSDTSNAIKVFTGQQSIQFQPNDRRMVAVVGSTDILAYTAGLLQNNIRIWNSGYITHLMLDGHNGFYSQGSQGWLTDKNRRIQFFGSLYHLFRTEPTLKSGLNFSYLHFTNNSITTYFSPNKYLSTEIFVDYSTPSQSKYYLQTQAAVGSQQIENQNWQSAYRFQIQVGMRTHHWDATAKYQTSNTAGLAGTGAGYKFNWLTLRVAYKW